MARLKFEHGTIDSEPPGWENDFCVVGDIDGDGLPGRCVDLRTNVTRP